MMTAPEIEVTETPRERRERLALEEAYEAGARTYGAEGRTRDGEIGRTLRDETVAMLMRKLADV